MTTEREEKKPIKISTTHCKHGDTYSIGVEVEDRWGDLTFSFWTHRPGGECKLNLFDMTLEDIMALGNAILEEGFRIKLLAQTKAEGKERRHASTK